MKASHLQKQKAERNSQIQAGATAYVNSNDTLVKYLIEWRLKEGMRRLTKTAKAQISNVSQILVMCAGVGYEGSILCNIGFENVTISDISDVGVAAALERDQRLKGLVLNAESTNLEDNSFDVVIVQDGLHHLQSPVQGLTEMLRISSLGVLFVEPHDSLVGNSIGLKWEKNGEAVNYVFRWKKKLIEDVASSYLGPDSFDNLSFCFWHHNIAFAKLGGVLGGGTRGIYAVRAAKAILDTALPGIGNQICGLILKR